MNPCSSAHTIDQPVRRLFCGLCSTLRPAKQQAVHRPRPHPLELHCNCKGLQALCWQHIGHSSASSVRSTSKAYARCATSWLWKAAYVCRWFQAWHVHQRHKCLCPLTSFGLLILCGAGNQPADCWPLQALRRRRLQQPVQRPHGCPRQRAVRHHSLPHRLCRLRQVSCKWL